MRPFSVVVATDEENMARLVLGLSADLSYVLTAHPVSGQMERIAVADCRIGRAFFNTDEVTWSNQFGPRTVEHEH